MQRVILSSCSQITSAVLLLSLLPSANSIDYILRGIGQSPFNLERLDRDQCSEVLNLLPTLSFEAVQEVDISKCPRLHLQSAIECFRKSFPSLRILKAAFLLKFKISTLRKLVRKCPMVCEVDLTTDTSPIISSQVSIVSSSPAITPQISNLSLNVRDMTSFYNSGLSIAKLTLEGRNDLYGEIVFNNFSRLALNRVISASYLKKIVWHTLMGLAVSLSFVKLLDKVMGKCFPFYCI